MPLPKFDKTPGISMGHNDSDRRLDLFFDLQCPYSQKSWQTIAQSLRYWSVEKLDVKFHAICLSHHRQSWDLTRGLFAVKKIDEDKAISYIDAIYSDHERFYNANWKERSQVDLLEFVANLVRSTLPNYPGDVLAEIESDDVFAEAKKSIHYAAVNKVWSTPTFFLDGEISELISSSSSLSEWSSILNFG